MSGLTEPILPSRELRCGDMRLWVQDYLCPVHVCCLPSHDLGRGAGMTVLSTLCSWDISLMICGRSLYQPPPPPPVCLPECRRLFHHGDASLLKTEQPSHASPGSWSSSCLHTFHRFSNVSFTWRLACPLLELQKAFSYSCNRKQSTEPQECRCSTLLGPGAYGRGVGRGPSSAHWLCGVRSPTAS